ncbi:MAG: hypothetical protein GY727_00425 [Gammaproteobacteria bacterium]|nr:hypothetical protein [Gammaproteobacteria bacterium]MCP4928524.1 hypothetical protein [Gammaproteobacteria bacterium]
MILMQTSCRRSFDLLKYIRKFLLLLPLAAAASVALAADVDRAPNFNAHEHIGLFIWRTAGVKSQWHVRLLGGNYNASFSGNFETDGAINNLKKIELQASDTVYLSNPSTMNIDFSVNSGEVDGVRFASNGEDLCLRSNSGPVAVRLGENAVVRTTPVDLTGTGSCAVEPPAPIQQKGLILTDNGKNVWEVRLISDDATETFKGTIESTENLRWFSKFKLESTDVLKKLTPTKLNVEFSAWRGGIDGTNVGVVPGSGLCVRATGGDYSQIVVVNKQGTASLRSAPVDVTNSGACGGGSPPPPPPPPTTQRKYNPGHYVAFMRGIDSQSIMAASIKAGVVGFHKRYTWRELEPSQGNYDFSEMAADLQFVASQGLKLVVMIEDKTFINENPMPNYLVRFPNRPGGYTGARWQSQYVNRFNALTAELGRRFDSNPAFEGVAIQESSLGISDDLLDANGYSAKAYSNALIKMIKTGLANMPNSRFFWYMNFLERGMGELEVITAAIQNTGAIIGGPDIGPDIESLQRWAYPIYREYADKVSFFGQIEPMVYHHEHLDPNAATKYWTMNELFRYGRDNLKVDYIFWMRYKKPKNTDHYDFNNALPVIENNLGFNK